MRDVPTARRPPALAAPPRLASQGRRTDLSHIRDRANSSRMHAWVTLIVTILVTLAAYVLGFLSTMPFKVSKVLLMANYLPQAEVLMIAPNEETYMSIQDAPGYHALLSNSRQISVKLGANVEGMMSMIWRVKRLAGWSMFYRAATIFFFQEVADQVLESLDILHRLHPQGSAKINAAFIASLFLSLLVHEFVRVAFAVVLYRIIVHPRSLRWFAPRESFNAVVTPHERKAPWRLLLNPGILTVVTLNAFVQCAVRLVRILGLIPQSDLWVTGLVLYSDLVYYPLESILVRLSTQGAVMRQTTHGKDQQNELRSELSPVGEKQKETTSAPKVQKDECDMESTDGKRHILAASNSLGHHGANALRARTGAAPQIGVYASQQKPPSQEPVILLRPCESKKYDAHFCITPREPYKGVWDCLCKMCAEEGYQSLYRGIVYELGSVFALISLQYLKSYIFQNLAE